MEGTESQVLLTRGRRGRGGGLEERGGGGVRGGDGDRRCGCRGGKKEATTASTLPQHVVASSGYMGWGQAHQALQTLGELGREAVVGLAGLTPNAAGVAQSTRSQR